MKTSQILKYAYVLILPLILLPACVDPVENDLQQNPTKEVDKVAFESKFAADAIWPTDVPKTIQICGNSAACNIAGLSPSMKISGMIRTTSTSGEFYIADGKLTICNESTGCTLSGHFDGTGTVNESGFNLSSFVTVDSGVGAFKADAGLLTLIVKAEKIPGMTDKLNYKMMVYGNIEHEADQ